MPRDGSGQYAIPPGTNGVPDTTIESAKYNAFAADLEVDLNHPRPIVAGGTGANNAHDAMIALSGEIAKQVVTNFDSFPFVNGSWYCTAGATSAPDGNNYFGIYYEDAASGNATVEARRIVGSGIGGKFVRQKNAGVWSSWLLQAGSAADLDAAYVNVTGDTMTGTLQITKGVPASTYTPFISINGAYGDYNSIPTIEWTVNNNGIGGARIGAHINPDASIDLVFMTSNNFNTIGGNENMRLNSVGALTIQGAFLTPSNINAYGTITAGANATGGSYYFGNTGTKYLNHDGTNFNLVGGQLAVNSPIVYAGLGGTTAAYYFGNTGTKYLQYDGTNFNLAGGALTVLNGPIIASASYLRAVNGYCYLGSGSAYLNYDGTNFNMVGGSLNIGGNITCNSVNGGDIYAARSATTGYFFTGSSGTHYLGFDGSAYQTGSAAEFDTGGSIRCGIGYICRAGAAGAYASSTFNFMYTGAVQGWIDTTNFGNITFSSDYRIKKDVIDLPGMWDTVKALRPIKYTQAQFSPPSHVKYIAEEALKAKQEAEENPEAKPREFSTAPLFPADDIERWGFIAHELQATLVPSASTGEKDSPDTIQSPNPFTVIAALTKALQEAMTRIESLEARVAQPR